MGFYSRIKQGVSNLASIGRQLAVRGVPGNYNRGRYFTDGRRRSISSSEAIRQLEVVRSGIEDFTTKCSRAEWKARPYDVNDRDAVAVAELVQRHVIDNPNYNFNDIVRRSSAYKAHGYSLQEWVMVPALDRVSGRLLWTFSGIYPVAQSTISSFSVDDRGNVTGVYQDQGQRTEFIEIEKLIYLVDNSLDDRPEGLGLLETLERIINNMMDLEEYERIGFKNDLKGVPIGRFNFRALEKARKNSQGGSKSYVEQDYDNLVKFLENQNRTENQYIIVDSEPYVSETTSGDRHVTSRKTDISTLDSGSQSFSDVNSAIRRYEGQIARLLGNEGRLLGSDSAGSFALAKDKSSTQSLRIDEALDSIAREYQTKLVCTFMDVNDLDMSLMPKLAIEESSFRPTDSTIDAVVRLESLSDEDPAKNDLRSKLGVEAKALPDGDSVNEESEENDNR